MKAWTIGPLAAVLALGMVAPAAAQDAQIPRKTGYAALEKLPDFTGVWNPDWSLLGLGTGGRSPVPPKLTPAAQKVFDAFQEKQKREGVNQERQISCLPPGMPGMMRQPYPIEFLFTPGRVTVFAETYAQTRRIYTDGRPLPEDPDPFFNGNSVGRWEGDVLYVDTVGFSPMVEISAGVPHGENMRIREKIWLEKPDVLRIETTITDPDVLTEPLVQQLAFRRQPTWEIREYVCEENNRLVKGEGGANIDLGLDEEGGEDPFGPAAE